MSGTERCHLLGLALATLVLAGCTDNQGPETGTIQVQVTNEGNPDAGGRLVLVLSDNERRDVAADGSTVISGVTPGEYQPRLEGTPCFVIGPDPETIRVLASETAVVTFVVSCAAPRGTLRVTAVTTGADPDPDGYLVSVGGVSDKVVRSNGVAVIYPQEGTHPLTVAGVAANCALNPDNPATVTVARAQVTNVTISATCVAYTGIVSVSVATTGADLDEDGYTARSVADSLRYALVDVNGTSSITRMPSGEQAVELTGLAGNCAVQGPNPRTVSVTVGQTVEARFAVECRQLPVLLITASTSGEDVDPDGYLVVASPQSGYYPGGGQAGVPANGTASINRLSEGRYVVFIAGVAANCTLQGPSTRTPTLSATGATLSLTVACVRAGTIAFVQDGNIALIRSNGTDMRVLTADGASGEPAWSPDGRHLAFTSGRDGQRELYVMNADGSGPRRVTNDAEWDAHPAWSPDGTRLVYSKIVNGRRELHAIGADGAADVRITSGEMDEHPDWSVTGRIAFRRNQSQQWAGGLYSVNPDGSGLRAEVQADLVGGAAWSPEGARLAYVRRVSDWYYGDTWYLETGTSGSVYVSGSDPSWSPDGNGIVLGRAPNGLLTIVRLDEGNRVVELDLQGADPDWQP